MDRCLSFDGSVSHRFLLARRQAGVVSYRAGDGTGLNTVIKTIGDTAHGFFQTQSALLVFGVFANLTIPTHLNRAAI
jgi:hypothetical protein